MLFVPSSNFRHTTLLQVSMGGTHLFVLLLLENLMNGKFHSHLREIFAPQVVRYVDLMESSVAQSIDKGNSSS